MTTTTARHLGLRTAGTIAVAAALLAATAVQPAAGTGGVTAVTGSAYGYWAYDIGFFGGSSPDTGPTPTVTLASDASNSPQQAAQPSGLVHYPPAVLFTSDAINVASAGAVGNDGFVTTSTEITNVNTSVTQPTLTGSEILTASSIASTCTALASGTDGLTTITGGILQLDSGWNDGDATFPEPAAQAGGTDEHLPMYTVLPAAPAANHTEIGHLHPFGGQTDHFTLVFNEQSTSTDGALTVNAVHEYYGTDPAGNTSVLKGHLVLGQSVCGVTIQGN